MWPETYDDADGNPRCAACDELVYEARGHLHWRHVCPRVDESKIDEILRLQDHIEKLAAVLTELTDQRDEARAEAADWSSRFHQAARIADTWRVSYQNASAALSRLVREPYETLYDFMADVRDLVKAIREVDATKGPLDL